MPASLIKSKRPGTSRSMGGANFLRLACWEVGECRKNILCLPKKESAREGEKLAKVAQWLHQGSEISTCHLLNFHWEEEEDRGEIVGCDMSAAVMPASSKSKGFRAKESLGDCQP